VAHLGQESLLGIGANPVNDQYAAGGGAGLDRMGSADLAQCRGKVGARQGRAA
jgi:hypothetical protein